MRDNKRKSLTFFKKSLICKNMCQRKFFEKLNSMRSKPLIDTEILH